MSSVFVSEEDAEAVRCFLDDRKNNFQQQIKDMFFENYGPVLDSTIRGVLSERGQQRHRLCDGCVFNVESSKEHCCENGTAGYFSHHGTALLQEMSQFDLDDAWNGFCDDLDESNVPRGMINYWFRINKTPEQFMETERNDLVVWLTNNTG